MNNAKRIFGAFVAAVALFFVWPGIVGSWQSVQAWRTARAEREQLLTDRTKILAQVASEYQTYTTTIAGTAGQTFDSLVPVRKDTAELLSAVQDIAQNSGVQVIEFRTSENRAKEGDAYRTLSLNMELTGAYVSMRSFLEGLEQYVRILTVDTIEVNSDARAPGTLRFAIRADTYYIK